MAVRENQSLQIALIIFVMLGMVLSVTTYLFFHNFQEEQLKVVDANNEASAASAEKQALIEQWADMRKLVAGKSQESLNQINEITDETKKATDQFELTMTRYAPDLAKTDPNRTYPFLVEQFYNEQASKNADLSVAKRQNEELSGDLKRTVNANEQEVATYHAATARFGEDLTNERAKFGADINAKHDQMTTLAAAKDASERRLNHEQQLAREQADGLRGTIGKLERDIKKMAKEMKAGSTQLSESPQGQVVLINQSNRTATINLGTLDGLRKQTVFSVYDSSATNVAGAKVKAQLEVLQIESDHVATCRILADNIKNLIMPHDVIHCPVWRPGQVEHFALAGFLDVDGDGLSDRQLIVDLITASGGVVDAQMDEKGNVTGKLTWNTEFLVLGDPPTERAVNPQIMTGFTRLLNEADKLSVRQVPLYRFLSHLGYRPERGGKGASLPTLAGITPANPANEAGFHTRLPSGAAAER